MAETEASYSTISVPFCWEEVPGTPKRNWKPATSKPKLVTPPAKFTVSIPFKWEEKPGKPLPSFLQPQPPSKFALAPPESSIYFLSSPRGSSVDRTNWGNIFHQVDDENEILDACSDIWQSSMDDFYGSAPLLGNSFRFIEHTNAVTKQQQTLEATKGARWERPASPSSESDDSTYATGESFLEWLFPLLSPGPDHLERVRCSEEGVNKSQGTDKIKDKVGQKDHTAEIPRPATLGELIMMSQRRSYQRKVMEMHPQGLIKETKKRRASGCCIYGPIDILSKFQVNSTRQLQLKLM